MVTDVLHHSHVIGCEFFIVCVKSHYPLPLEKSLIRQTTVCSLYWTVQRKIKVCTTCKDTCLLICMSAECSCRAFFSSRSKYMLWFWCGKPKKEIPPAGWALNELFRSACCVFCRPILLNGIFYGTHQRRLQMQDSLGIPASCIASLRAWETKLKMLEFISLLVSP